MANKKLIKWVYIREGHTSVVPSKIWKCSNCGFEVEWCGDKFPDVECLNCKEMR